MNHPTAATMAEALERLLEHPGVQGAVECAAHDDERVLAEQAAISAVPAPPFQEGERGLLMGELMSQTGLERVRTDPAGNVLAELAGTGVGPPLVISAHLDTVFPAGTDVTVTRDGDVLRGPGISDDARGLAVLLAMARCVRESGLACRTPLLFAATVGEEGVGDLRGVRFLFGEGDGREAAGFISVDGAGLDRLVVRALGSRRFRITVRGPGGHSWVDWGLVNPIHALGITVTDLLRLPLCAEPLTALTVARWGGGTSINAIPQEAWIEVDTRSESDTQLEELERRLREIAHCCAAATGSGGPLQVEVEALGRRPAGGTDPDAPLLQAAIAATRHLGGEPTLTTSSTDANIPMAAGIPAVTLGGGGSAGLAHTTEEWYRNVQGAEGVQRLLLTALLAAGPPV